jgi:nucleotide-binding universal stress UspA family protein
MRILICSDGMPASTAATRLGGIISRGTGAETVLLGIVENPPDEAPLREALEREAQQLQQDSIVPNIVIRAGEPIREIVSATSASTYDLVVIGAQHKDNSGLYWRSEKTYELIKAISPPVLVAIGNCDTLKRFLVCTGGRAFIDEALNLTGELAGSLGASVTLLHVMAEPPAMYADLVQLEEDLDRLLESKSELGLNLRKQKETLERLGAKTEVRIRHGIVLDEVFDEIGKGNYDLVVTGSSQALGMVRHYIMGDVTRAILNRAECPILVARAGLIQHRSFWSRLKNTFVGGRG